MGKTAFDAKRSTSWRLDPDEVVILTGANEPDPLQRARADMPVSEGLVIAMMKVGFFGAAIIRRDGPRAIAVDGRQRIKAAREVKKRQLAEGVAPGKTILVECHLADGSDAKMTMIGVMLNGGEQHADNPVLQAHQIAHLLSMGQSEQDIADIYFRKVSWVKQLRALLNTHQRIQDAVTRGELPISAAAQLSKLERSKQLEELAAAREASKSEKVTVKQVKKAIKKKATGKDEIEPPSKKHALKVASFMGADEHDLVRWVLTGKMPDDPSAREALEDAIKSAKEIET